MEKRPMESRISRRRMLKRIGAGAAVAWSAPVLSSLRTPAFAQGYPPVCREPCEFTCGGTVQECGPGIGGFGCLCDHDVAGECFCLNDAFCSDLAACTTSGDCLVPGFRCVPSTCCPTAVCAPPCGILPRVTRSVEDGQTISGIQPG